jgi:hypothetical protein
VQGETVPTAASGGPAAESPLAQTGSRPRQYEEHGSYRLTKVLADVGDAVKALEAETEPSTTQLLAIVSLQQEALFHLALHLGDIQSTEH